MQLNITQLEELVNQNNLDALFIKSILQYIQFSTGNAFFDDISSLDDNLDHLINNGYYRAIVYKTMLIKNKSEDT